MSKFLISLKIVCYCLPLHSLRTFASLICISIAHQKQSMFLLRAFPFFFSFYPEVKNLKLCPFVTNNLSQILSTSQTFNYCWPLLKLPLAFLLTSHGRLLLTMVSTKGWRWVFYVRLFCFVMNVLNVTKNNPHNCWISVLIIHFPKQMLS